MEPTQFHITCIRSDSSEYHNETSNLDDAFEWIRTRDWSDIVEVHIMPM